MRGRTILSVLGIAVMGLMAYSQDCRPANPRNCPPGNNCSQAEQIEWKVRCAPQNVGTERSCCLFITYVYACRKGGCPPTNEGCGKAEYEEARPNQRILGECKGPDPIREQGRVVGTRTCCADWCIEIRGNTLIYRPPIGEQRVVNFLLVDKEWCGLPSKAQREG